MIYKISDSVGCRPPHHVGPTPDGFYVTDGECMACGAPDQEAPKLMSHQLADGQCFFVRQPLTEDEVDQAILAVNVSCCEAVRYDGHDAAILRRVAELGCARQCDFPLAIEPPPISISVVRYKFAGSEETHAAAKQV